MGQWGDKTYECDYIEDTIDDYDLDPDIRKDRMLTSLEVKEILEIEDEKEVVLGIISFIIDTWENHKLLLSPKNLEDALFYAGSLLKNFDYACRWFTNWNDRMDALEKEMRNIHKLINPSVTFDFSKYDKINQSSLLDVKNWERFDKNHQFYVLEHLVRTLGESPEPQVINIIKEDIEKFQDRVGDDVSSRLVLAAIALSKIDGEDAINVIFENINNSFSWVIVVAKEYLAGRLDHEEDNHLCKKISEIISNL